MLGLNWMYISQVNVIWTHPIKFNFLHCAYATKLHRNVVRLPKVSISNHVPKAESGYHPSQIFNSSPLIDILMVQASPKIACYCFKYYKKAIP